MQSIEDGIEIKAEVSEATINRLDAELHGEPE